MGPAWFIVGREINEGINYFNPLLIVWKLLCNCPPVWGPFFISGASLTLPDLYLNCIADSYSGSRDLVPPISLNLSPWIISK